MTNDNLCDCQMFLLKTVANPLKSGRHGPRVSRNPERLIIVFNPKNQHSMRINFSKSLLATALSLSLPQGLWAADLFNLNLTVNQGTASEQTGSTSFSTVEQLFNQLDSAGLTQVANTYKSTADATALIDYRGLGMTINAVGKDVTLKIPGVISDQVFNTGATRDDNLNQLEDFFKRDGGAILSAIQKKLAATSPVDPIAGNPNSLQSTMVASGFDQSFTAFASNVKAVPGSGAQASDNSGLVALGLRFGSYSQNGLRSDSVTLPLSYTYRGFGEGRQLSFNLPITVGQVGSAKVVQGGLGVAYRHPVNENWALTPAASLGAAGSIDLGSAAAMTSYSLTSQYTIPLDEYEFSIGNMIGRYETLKIQTKDYSYDPGISNMIYRNGVMVSKRVDLGGKPMALEFSVINTVFTGSELYNKWTNEYGMTIGTRKGSDLPSYLRAGISLLQGQKSHGVSFNVGYWF